MAKGGRTDNGIFRHTERVSEMSGRGLRGAGVDNVQVDGVPKQERSCGAGEIYRCYDDKWILMGGSRME